MNKLLLVLLISFPVLALTQQYANDWVRFDQQYYKIQITEEGIYRIDYNALNSAGIPLSTIDPRNFQLFCKGKEQYIYVSGESDGVFHTNDYIEFYGVKNDGLMDTIMYDQPENHINQYFSLVNDTNAYFLTWNLSLSNKRLGLETAVDFSNYTQANYCLKPVYSEYTGSFAVGAEINGPFYTAGEGWFSGRFGLDNGTITPMTVSFTLDNIYSSGPDVTFDIRSASASSYYHHLRTSLLSLTSDTIFNGYKSIIQEFTFPASSLTGTLDITLTAVQDAGSYVTDFHRISGVYFEYPHTYDFNGEEIYKFIVPDDVSNNKAFISVSNFNGGSNPVLYDLTNNKRITVINSSGIYNALIPNASANKTCYITAESNINSVSSLNKIIFKDFSSYGFNSNYIIISHPKIWSGAQDYESYRNSTGYQSFLVDINDLYEQFAYGIYKHPASIRNFIHYISDTYDSVPEYLFLIGKGRHSPNLRNTATYSNCLIPSFGYLSSDALLSAGKYSSKWEPVLATGRIACNTAAQVNDYLQKVVTYESNFMQDWMKHIAHFRGGYDTIEQNIFEGYLNNYKNIIEDTLFGGYVSTFRKNNSAPMSVPQAQMIKDRIDAGVSLMTFFGHGTASGFDINVEDPAFYENQSKYPFIIANSCLAGDIHQSSTGISEDWVLFPQKGAIAFLATVDQSEPDKLNWFTNEIYNQISYKNYNGTLGNSILSTIRHIINNYSANSGALFTSTEFTLHGDPAIIINAQARPDYIINSNDIYFNPVQVTTEIDSFDVNVVVTNLGMAVSDTVILKLIRTYPDQSADTLYSLTNCYYKDTIVFRLALNRSKSTGLNTFCAKIDDANAVLEMDETNNEGCTQLNIISSDLIPVYPYEYAIYPNNTVTLMASTGNPFLTNQTSIFQIDTTDAFNSNSPFFQSTSISHNGGIVQWTVPYTLTDSTVYYWRVSKSGTTNWKESSFIYIPGKTGWSQAHHFQFKKDTYQNIDYDYSGRRFDFILTPKTLHCQNIGGNANAANGYRDIYYDIDGNTLGRTSCCSYSALILAVIDPLSLENWKSDYADFGHSNYPNCLTCNPGSPPSNYFIFWNNTSNLENLANMLGSIPNDYHILLYSFIDGKLNTWPPNLYAAIQSLYPGTDILTYASTPNYPYIFYCQKGNPLSGEELIGSHSQDTISIYPNLETNYTKGNITSTLIGPGYYWETLHWKQYADEQPDHDTLSLTVYGVTNSGIKDKVMTIKEDSTDIYDLYNYIDAGTYPYLYLNLYTEDDSSKTPAQMDKWQLTYENAPETAIHPEEGYYFSKDTVQEGEDVVFAVATKNISPYDMDSLLVKFWHQDKNNYLHPIKTKRLALHPAGDVIMDTVIINTLGYPGLNSVWIEYNPVNDATGYYDQMEQHHFNNIAQKYFYVESDKTNPILDVTFDGVHILDGDIVSAKPEILIQLNDENKYLPVDDLSLFQVFLKSPDEDTEVLLQAIDSTGKEVLSFIPAELPENKAKIYYNPEFKQDGIYELAVKASDASLNESGDYEYRISFEVINKSTITNIFNYPNPFSTSTRFVFELTGSEIPTDLQIQIFTITGKIVKTINIEDLGNIHIGRNITDYAWDGYDMYGDKLANGVYFYKVKARIDGEDIEKRDTNTDKYFKKNIGKMYIMR